MDYVALYRKWRPQDFSSLIGQEHIKTAISNALLHNRIAHAYLFSGPRGTGKTSTAKILAKAVNCEKGPTPEPCNVCINCERINKGSSMDVFEIDAASNRGIDEIRELREKIRFSPVEGRKRVYIIDEVHMLTTEAFNALLKTLEEPPEHVLFILATTEPHKLPATILSRCQRYDFRRLGIEDTIARLEEVAQNSDLKITKGALKLIAAQADGGMRDALSLLDQCSVMAENEINEETVRSLLGIVGKDALRELLKAIGQKQEKQVLQVFDQLLLGGKDIKQLLGELSSYFRAVLLFKTSPDFSDIYITDSKENLEDAAMLFSEARLIAAAKRLHSAVNELRFSIQPRITAEVCLLELCDYEAADTKALLERIDKLEAMLAQLSSGKLKMQSDMSQPVKPLVDKVTEKPAVLQEKQPEVIDSIKTEKVKPVEPTPKVNAQEHEMVEKTEATEQPAIGDFDELWQKTLQAVLKQNKRSLYACAANGKLVSLDKGVAILQFEGDFACKRMGEADYREVVEKELSLLANCQVTLQCKSGSHVKEKPKEKNKNVKTPPVQDELPDAVRAALEIFGGEVYKIEK